MKIELTAPGLKELRAGLKEFSDRRFNAAVATALTRTAVNAREAAQEEARRSLDKPTTYTLRQLRYVPATAKTLSAVVGFNIAAIQDAFGRPIRYQVDRSDEIAAAKYLQYQVEGGTRRLKRFERALQSVGVLPSGYSVVPGERARMDAYGNQAAGEIRQILSYFDAAELGQQGNILGSRQNSGAAGRARRLKGTRTRAGFDYFVAPVGGRRTFQRASGKTGTKAMQPGIYRRTLTAFGTRIEPVMIFVRSTQYRPRFDFYGRVQQAVDRTLPFELDRAIRESAERLAARRAA